MLSGIYKVLILIFLPTFLIQLYCLQLFPSFICSFQKACAAQMLLLLLLLPVGERDGFNISKVPHRKKASDNSTSLNSQGRRWRVESSHSSPMISEPEPRLHYGCFFFVSTCYLHATHGLVRQFWRNLCIHISDYPLLACLSSFMFSPSSPPTT